VIICIIHIDDIFSTHYVTRISSARCQTAPSIVATQLHSLGSANSQPYTPDLWHYDIINLNGGGRVVYVLGSLLWL